MKKHLLYIAIFILLVGCDQSEWLDVKSNKSDVAPSTLEDYKALLNNDEVMNQNHPTLGVSSSDNFYLTDDRYQALSEYDRNSYIWNKYIDIYSYDWMTAYKCIAIANIVLDNIDRFSDKALVYRQTKGSAYFFRALNFFNLAQQYSNPYDKATANTDLGVVLKLTGEVDEPVKRSTVEETYLQIIQDLNSAIDLLPTSVSLQTKPSKAAALALMGRVLFYMENYDNALIFTLKALELNSNLLDFNSINRTSVYPFPTMQAGNKEIIFYSSTATRAIIFNNRIMVPKSGLYDLYNDNDLRKTLYYNASNLNTISFRGNYTGLINRHFAGIATNELYLTIAECYARTGNQGEALRYLNTLLRNRYMTNSYVDFNTNDDEELLRKILLERNKELPYTGIIRWMDLRRLNKDTRFAITLVRSAVGETYTLPPNDPRYVLPLPDDEVRINGLEQNER